MTHGEMQLTCTPARKNARRLVQSPLSKLLCCQDFPSQDGRTPTSYFEQSCFSCVDLMSHVFAFEQYLTRRGFTAEADCGPSAYETSLQILTSPNRSLSAQLTLYLLFMWVMRSARDAFRAAELGHFQDESSRTWTVLE